MCQVAVNVRLTDNNWDSRALIMTSQSTIGDLDNILPEMYYSSCYKYVAYSKANIKNICGMKHSRESHLLVDNRQND